MGKVHVEDLKPFQGKTASKENSEGEQAKASPSEISEERNASFTSHGANAEVPEAEAHPRMRGRPRKARLVVKRTAQLLGRRANKRTLVQTALTAASTQTTWATRRFGKHLRDYPYDSALVVAHESDDSPCMQLNQHNICQ